jgi:hypothetical protein
MPNLNEVLAQQSAEEAARIAKALDFSESGDAIAKATELVESEKRRVKFFHSHAEADRDNEAILEAARAAGFRNATMK